MAFEGDRWRRWQRRHLARYSREAMGSLLRPLGAFHRLRLMDGWRRVADHKSGPAPVHVHLNLAPRIQSGRAALVARNHADETARSWRQDTWYGGVNARVGRRRAALDRVGFKLVNRGPAHTLSWVLDAPIEQLTILREVPVCSW